MSDFLEDSQCYDFRKKRVFDKIEIKIFMYFSNSKLKYLQI